MQNHDPWEALCEFTQPSSKDNKVRKNVMDKLVKWRNNNELDLRYATLWRSSVDGEVQVSVENRQIKIPFPDLRNFDVDDLERRFEAELPGCTLEKPTAMKMLEHDKTCMLLYCDNSNGYPKNILSHLYNFWRDQNSLPPERRKGKFWNQQVPSTKRKRVDQVVGLTTQQVLANATKRSPSVVHRVGGSVHVDKEATTATLEFIKALAKHGIGLTHKLSVHAGGDGEVSFADGGRPDLVSYDKKGKPVLLAESKCTHVRDGYKVLQYAQSAERQISGWVPSSVILAILMDKQPPPAEVQDAENLGEKLGITLKIFWPDLNVASWF